MFIECFGVGLRYSTGAMCQGGDSFVGWSLFDMVNGAWCSQDWLVSGMVK